ncbi:hypothetical protein V7075_13350, partial [Neobacillus drentensis]|uniref:hypothetical protein n=1 Tax=Neobacillus drentensis TaxID=220684 RepID=UPI002FFE5B59
MLTAGILIFILLSTLALIVLLDLVQDHELYEAWFSLSKLIKVAKGEDFFLILIYFIILVLLI